MVFRFLIRTNLRTSNYIFETRRFKMTETNQNLCYTKYDKNRLKIIGKLGNSIYSSKILILNFYINSRYRS